MFLHPPIVVVVDEQDVDGDRGVDEKGHGKEMQNLAENNFRIKKASVNHAYPRSFDARASFVNDARILTQDSRALYAYFTRI